MLNIVYLTFMNGKSIDETGDLCMIMPSLVCRKYSEALQPSLLIHWC